MHVLFWFPLLARPPQNKARRERPGWQVENLARGLAYVRERLGALRTQG